MALWAVYKASRCVENISYGTPNACLPHRLYVTNNPGKFLIVNKKEKLRLSNFCFLSTSKIDTWCRFRGIEKDGKHRLRHPKLHPLVWTR